MTIYHFCCMNDLRGILSQGLTKGMIVRNEYVKTGNGKVKNVLGMYPGWQWLTVNKHRDSQSWATRFLVKYDRTQYRLTIEIPEKYLDSLYDREHIKAVIDCDADLFENWEGCESWRVYRGKIPKYWIKGIARWDYIEKKWDTEKIFLTPAEAKEQEAEFKRITANLTMEPGKMPKAEGG